MPTYKFSIRFGYTYIIYNIYHLLNYWVYDVIVMVTVYLKAKYYIIVN